MKTAFCVLVLFTAVFIGDTSAQINVISDARSVQASGSIDTNMLRSRYAIDPNPSITYSGGHSESQVNPSGSQTFDYIVSGSESAKVQYHPSPTTNIVYTANYYGQSSAHQQSTVDSFHIYYYGNVLAAGMHDVPFQQGAHELSSSLLSVAFTVDVPTTYTLDVTFNPPNANILSTSLMWSLSSQQHGSVGNDPSQLIPAHVSGILFPGDTYIFKANAYAESIFDGDGGNGGMIATLAVPEPSSFALLVSGLTAFALSRQRSKASHR